MSPFDAGFALAQGAREALGVWKIGSGSMRVQRYRPIFVKQCNLVNLRCWLLDVGLWGGIYPPSNFVILVNLVVQKKEGFEIA